MWWGSRPQIETCAIPFPLHPLVVVAPTEHTLAGDNGRDALRRSLFVALPWNDGLCAHREVNIKIRMEPDSNEAIEQTVIGGLGPRCYRAPRCPWTCLPISP